MGVPFRPLPSRFAPYRPVSPLTVQLWVSFTSQRRQTYDDEQVSVLMLMIAERRVGKRPGRIGPRAVKRLPKPMPLLTKPRQVAKAQVERYGHPKKLKQVPFVTDPFFVVREHFDNDVG